MASQDTAPGRSSTSGSRSAVRNRVPTKVLAGLGARRTSQEVKAANLAAAAAAKTAREKAQARHESIQQRIGELEDELQREDTQRKKVATRPDLHEKMVADTAPAATGPGTKKATKKQQEPSGKTLKIIIKLASAKAATTSAQAAESAVDAGIEPDTPSGDVDPPSIGAGAGGGEVEGEAASESSQAASPSSASMEEASSFVPFNNEFEDSSDREDDSDYEENGEDEDESEEQEQEADDSASDGNCQKGRPLSKSRQTKGTKAGKGLSYRTSVNARRETSSTSAISKAVQNKLLKRKERAEDSDDVNVGASTSSTNNHVRSKRSRYEEPSGLLKGFRSAVVKKKRASTSSRQSQSLASDANDTDEYNGGVFDHDEDESLLMLARDSKAKSLTRGSKPQTKVRVIEPEPVTLPLAITRRKFKKEQCKKSNLPFPAAHVNRCLVLWNQRFKSTLIAWNATLRQPFSSGTLLSTEVKLVREKVFGSLAPLDKDDDHWHIVEIVAGDFLLNWRSEIGKTAITVTVAIFRSELMDKIEEGEGNEAGVEAARYLLDDHRFAYGNPDAEEDESAQPFQSPFILQTFSSHLRQVIHAAKDYKISGDAIGALGLCAAAVERALTLIRDGHVSINQWPPALLPPVQAVDAGDSGPGAPRAGGSNLKLKGLAGSGRRRKANFTPFSESAWGSHTRAFADTAAQLSDDHWNSITEEAITDDIQQTIDALQLVGDSDDEDVLAAGGKGRANRNSRANLRM
ncbi:hypothetical protein EST38_g12065 [Candolleomyces aberdarensis]|uniref:Uncharacterized protein n=1 Tax=Candolleomyces aberdarensis TaxID=2316362 RepID=A0A4Q2D413_9AGAR|nr:hypothetical protein EST38_g12065 [Candolleomyces aberdarensis]